MYKRQIQYEAVEYGAGKIVPGDPEGFALQNYDLEPSPLNSADLTNTTIDDISSTPNLSGIGVIPANKTSIVDNKLRTVNNYLNNKNANNTITNNNTTIINIINSTINTNINTTVNVNFAGGNITQINAKPSNLTGTI